MRRAVVFDRVRQQIQHHLLEPGMVAGGARTTPLRKLRLVQALQAGGLVVAMTADGVNDAPAPCWPSSGLAKHYAAAW